MTLEQFQSDAERFRASAVAAFDGASNPDELEHARVQYLGDRSGLLRDLQQALGALPKEHKPVAGRAFNEVKRTVTEAHQGQMEELAEKFYSLLREREAKP